LTKRTLWQNAFSHSPCCPGYGQISVSETSTVTSCSGCSKSVSCQLWQCNIYKFIHVSFRCRVMDTQYWRKHIAIITILSAYGDTTDAMSCKYREQYRHMDCTDVNLGTLQPGVYPLNISEIKTLKLRNTSISPLLGSEFHNLKYVERLDLPANGLKYVPHNLFSSLSELLILHLGYNKIASLTDKRIFASQRKLLYLYLEWNQLTTLPAEVLHPLVSLQRLYLARNPFICDCQLYPAMLWCQQKCFITEATCKLPANHTWSSWSAGNNGNCTELSEPRSAASEGDSCKYYCLYIE